MNNKGIISGITLSIIIIGLTFIVGFIGVQKKEEPVDLYQVYLDGEIIGVIKDKQKLLDLIDDEQKELKREYDVNKVYPPNGLKIQKIRTYEGDVQSVEYIYNKIKNKETFTIKGYTVTIHKSETEKVILNVINKKDFTKAVKNTITTFLNADNYSKYLDGTQGEITDYGTIIEDVDLKEKITYKEAYLSSNDKILKDSSEISQYLLFGTLEKQKEYVVKEGDTLETIASKNNLSLEEFLIANEDIPSENTLLFPGQSVNIGLIEPQVSVVVTSSIVEKQQIKYKTEEKWDEELPVGTTEVEQKGMNGESKVTIKQEIVNGEITYAVITKSEEITPAVNKIVKKGGLYINGNATGDWAWPTISPYVITSNFGPRWGRLHDGIDISGCGHGSPIYASNAGTVTAVTSGGSMGMYIYISHGNNYYTGYLHLSKQYVKVGQVVKKGQVIGAMGNTGRSTGTHLHFAVYTGGKPHAGGTAFNPLTLFD